MSSTQKKPRFATKQEEKDYQHNWYLNSGRRERYQEISKEDKKEMNEKRSIFKQSYEKRMMIRHSHWKRKGIVFYDKEAFNELYFKTNNCQLCDIEITEDGVRCHSQKKVLDHDHECGHWRFICCHTCNTQLKSYDMCRMRLMCELHRKFNLL